MFAIGVAGQAQMGKDTLADYLCDRLKERGAEWHRVAFADNVKKVYQDTFDKDRAFIEEWKVKPECPPGFDKTVRESLQFIGDGFRTICPTIWLDLVFRKESRPIIVSDVRYVNEFVRVKNEGGLNILVGRTDKLNTDPNGSESQIRPYVKWCLDALSPQARVVEIASLRGEGCPVGQMDKFDLFVRNDGTVEEFYESIDAFVVPFVERFVFQFPEQTSGASLIKEEECLISN